MQFNVAVSKSASFAFARTYRDTSVTHCKYITYTPSWSVMAAAVAAPAPAAVAAAAFPASVNVHSAAHATPSSLAADVVVVPSISLLERLMAENEILCGRLEPLGPFLVQLIGYAYLY